MREELRSIWIETFKGIEEGEPSHFIETKPGSGIFGTIAKLSAQQASLNINDNTIAAHAHHTMYHITVCISFLEGNEPEADWSKSWKISEVDGEEWQNIRDSLEIAYNKMLKRIEINELDDLSVRFILSSLSHSAYHLGAIRQMVKNL